MRERPVLLCNTGVHFSSRNHFANLGSFEKVFVSVGFKIPRLNAKHLWNCLLYEQTTLVVDYIHLSKPCQTKSNTCLVYYWSYLIIHGDALLRRLTDVKRGCLSLSFRFTLSHQLVYKINM